MTSRKKRDRMKVLAVNGRLGKNWNTTILLQKALGVVEPDSYL